MTKIDAKTVEALANYYEHPGYTPDSRMLHTAATLRALRDALDEATRGRLSTVDYLEGHEDGKADAEACMKVMRITSASYHRTIESQARKIAALEDALEARDDD